MCSALPDICLSCHLWSTTVIFLYLFTRLDVWTYHLTTVLYILHPRWGLLRHTNAEPQSINLCPNYNCKFSSSICSEGLGKIKSDLSNYSRILGRDSHSGPPEHQARALFIQSVRSLIKLIIGYGTRTFRRNMSPYSLAPTIPDYTVS
jgi:hypothetical protein